ncbi:MAG: hypothetical protein M9921_02240 [Fimbriimonadaceae bacterium]|nr:hypothetical protein [Fimbriimonadaceae bacterium]
MNAPDPWAPIRWGRCEVPNRLVVAPMTTYSSRPDGVISDDEIPYLRRRAEGGFGAVMTAACCVHPGGKAFVGQWACWDDRFLPSLRRVADSIREGGAVSVLQIHHGGRRCPSLVCGGQPVSASAVPLDDAAEVPRALAGDEVEELVEAYGAAAARGQAAGFDAIEIHGANTYLLQQFVSPHSNRRTDAWGRDRLLFSERVSRSVLEAVGPEFPVGYRFSPEEPLTPGIRLADTLALIDRLMALPLAYLHVSLRAWDQPSLHGGTEPILATLASHIDRRVPLIGVGAIRSLEDVRGAMALGADQVALARVAISDPEWPLKVRAGAAVRLRVPRHEPGTLLTLPKGLEAKILSTPGWFDVEDPPA